MVTDVFRSPFCSLILILLLGLLLRVGFCLQQPVSRAAIDRLPDQREYLSLARNLLHDHALGFFDPRFGQTVYAYRMPGYPLFLAALGGSIRLARLTQCVIDTSTLLAVFLIGKRLSSNSKIAWIAVGLMAVNPFYVYFTSLLLSETLFIALIAWAIWFIVTNRWLLATVFLIAGCYVRPTGVLFVVLLLWVPGSNRPTGRAYRLWDGVFPCAAAYVLLIMALIPWAWRNYNLLGDSVWSTTNTGVTLYDGFNPAATGASDQRIVTNLAPLASINEAARSRYFQTRAIDWIEHNASAIPALSAKKVLRGWSPVPLSQEFGRPLYQFISAAYSVPFDLLCLIGLFSKQLSSRAKLLLLAPAVIVTAQQVMSVGSIRYSMPAECSLAVIAAAGMHKTLSRKFE